MDNMYDNIGGKIKRLAKWTFIVEAIGAIIAGLVLMGRYGSTYTDLVCGFLLFVGGPIVAWVSSWLLYAFGELVEDTHAIREKYARDLFEPKKLR